MGASAVCLSSFLASVFFLTSCGKSRSAQLADAPQPNWPSLPTLNDPLFYPQNGSYVPDAVEFQFNPTLKEVNSVKVISLNGTDSEEFLSSGSLAVLESGLCLRFESEGGKVLEVSGVNYMGQVVKGRVQFVVQGQGASVKTCTPWSGARSYSLKDPFWKPSVSGPDLPPTDGPILVEGPWNFAVRVGNAVWPVEWTCFAAFAVERYAADLLRSDFLPKGQVEKLCPRFFEASVPERKAFWALFLASIAYPESAFNPSTRYREPPPLSKWSEGVLQLSTDDYVSHGTLCNFMKSPERILNPFDNIRCGAVILRNQILHRHTLWPDTYYYWAVLTTRKRAVVREVFRANAEKSMGFCF
jgi:hypothetical protein